MFQATQHVPSSNPAHSSASATYMSVGTVLGQMPKLPAAVPHSSMLAEGCHAKLLAGAGSWRTATWAHRQAGRRSQVGREGQRRRFSRSSCRCWRCCCVLDGPPDSAGGWHTEKPTAAPLLLPCLHQHQHRHSNLHLPVLQPHHHLAVISSCGHIQACVAHSSQHKTTSLTVHQWLQ